MGPARQSTTEGAGAVPPTPNPDPPSPSPAATLRSTDEHPGDHTPDSVARLRLVTSDPPPVSGTKQVARRPLLASEALMEDLAPVEPERNVARAWLAGVGGGSLLVGALPATGILPGTISAAIPWWFTGAIAVVAALIPVSYRRRAVAMVVLGLLSSIVALRGANGALMNADGGTAWGAARLVAAVALPAALLFRARYRAYAGARVALGAALCLSLPFAVHAVMRLFEAPGLATVGPVAVLLVLAGSLAGFMGAETTGAGAALGPATVVIIAGDVALRAVGSSPIVGVASDVIAFGGAASLASLGLFQILAWRFAADARRIDIHTPPKSEAGAQDPDAPSDWSTRE